MGQTLFTCSQDAGRCRSWLSWRGEGAAIKTSTMLSMASRTKCSRTPLRRAERDGLILRHLDPGRVETATLYRLTDLGRSLDEPLAAMAEWADANWQAVEAAQQRWDRLRQASD